MQKLTVIILPVLFFIMIVFPFVNKYVHILPTIPNNENRTLAKEPEFNIGKLDAFPKKYEDYYNDNTSIRNNLLQVYNYIAYFILNKTCFSPKVINGRNGWLFRSENEQAVYEGNDMFSQKELEKYAELLVRREQELKKMNCAFYFVIAPVKQSIYPEYLPAYLYIENAYTRSDQLIDYVKNKTNVKVVDLRKPLLEAKNGKNLYYKNDNHWNDIGAFVASNAIISAIKMDFPLLDTISFSDYHIVRKEWTGGNIAELLGLQRFLKDTDLRLTPFKCTVFDGQKRNYKPEKGFPYTWAYCVVKTTYSPGKLKLLMIRDSFGNKVIPFIASAFGETICIWDSWEYKLNVDIVKAEKPDVYVTMVLESHLDAVLKHYDDK